MTSPAQAALEQGVAVMRGPGATPPPPRACLAVAAAGRRLLARDGPDDAPPLTGETVVDVGSVTKVLSTTSALAALLDAGLLATTTPVGSLLPAARRHPVGRASLADLLLHRAGLAEWVPLYLTTTGPSSSPDDPDDALGRVLDVPLRHPPGQGRHYSDLGFMLLGACVSAAAGLDLDAAVEQLALRPAGLAATTWRSPAPGRPVAASSHGDAIERAMVATGQPYPVSEAMRQAAGTFGWREHLLVGEVNDGNAHHAFGGVAGHAGLFSTMDDLLLAGQGWLACLRGEGWVSEGTMRRFLRPGPGVGADPHQALGFRRWVDAADDCHAEAFGHTGFPGVGVAIVPAHGAALAMATDRLLADGPPRPGEQLWRTALAAAHRALHAPDLS